MTLPFAPLTLGTTLPMYIGRPGAMNRLPMPDSPYQSVANRGETVQVLASGGTAVTRNLKVKRTWALPMSGKTPDTANILVAYYAGSMGLGPFVLMDPAWRNVLDRDVSSMGSAISAITGWAVSVTASSLSFDTSGLAAPFVQSEVMDWTGAGNTNKFGMGSWAGGVLIPDATSAPVYLLDQVAGGSIYARTVSSTASVSYSIAGVNAAGAVQVAGTTATATVTNSAWTKLSSFLASGNASALYILPTITCNTGSAPVMQFACADLQYGITALTQQPWVLGLGSPRVNVVPDSSGFTSISHLIPFRDHTLMFAEV